MKDALQKFVNWLKAKNKKVVLFAHNGNAFDSKRIVYTLMRCNLLNPFRECVAGFVDTLSLFKNVLPERKTYSQESLVTDLLGVSYEAHDSLEDVRALQKLVAHVNVSSKEISESSFTVDYAVESTKYCVNRATNMNTLQPLLVAKVISKGMAEKIAGSNLQLCHMNLAFQRGDLEGIASILSEMINGKARVRRSKGYLNTAVQIIFSNLRSCVNTLQVNIFHHVYCYHYLHFLNNCTLSMFSPIIYRTAQK